MVFAQNGTLNLSDSRFGWPAQHDWLRRYFVFEHATYALDGLANLRITMFNSGLQCPDLTVRQNMVIVALIGGLETGSWCL